MRRERCGSSVINHRKSEGSCGGLMCLLSVSRVFSTIVRRGALLGNPSTSDSAPPYKLKSIKSVQNIVLVYAVSFIQEILAGLF